MGSLQSTLVRRRRRSGSMARRLAAQSALLHQKNEIEPKKSLSDHNLRTDQQFTVYIGIQENWWAVTVNAFGNLSDYVSVAARLPGTEDKMSLLGPG